MTPAARVAAAIEILGDIETKRRPASDSLKDWGLARRFAGSKDRAAIASLVYDGLRRRASSAWMMGEDTPRAAMLGSLRSLRRLAPDAVASLFTGEGHAPRLLSEAEAHRIRDMDLEGAPAHVRGDYPEWLAGSFERAFGAAAVAEGEALSRRAPLDLRANTLKSTREKAFASLAHLRPEPTPLSPLGLRLPLAEDGRGPSLQVEPAWIKGQVEVQDEGSQLATLLTIAKAGQQVLDLCAGGGGKSLALAGLMENKGQIYATDSDGHRLAPIHARVDRAGARNIQVRTPRAGTDVIADLHDRCDVVLVDAPCTGTGTWRRNPDAKWRIRPGALTQRLREQDEVLAAAARFVQPGGRLVYVTCSILVEENEDRIAAFLAARDNFVGLPPQEVALASAAPGLADHVSTHGPGIRMSPHTTATDGFFIAVLQRVG